MFAELDDSFPAFALKAERQAGRRLRRLRRARRPGARCTAGAPGGSGASGTLGRHGLGSADAGVLTRRQRAERSCSGSTWTPASSPGATRFRQTEGPTRWETWAVTHKGDVYASDSRAPALYRIPAGRDTLEQFLETPLLLSGQGLAFSPDERRLYVADYSRGIIRVNLADRTAALLPAADTVLALGIDGLYYHDGALIGIQNGVTPHRVARLELSADGERIERSAALERGHPRHHEPTLGALVGGDLYYVANSQYERFGEDGRIAQPDSLEQPVVLRLRL